MAMLIDVSMPIVTGSVFRLGTPPVEVAEHQFHHESEGDFEAVMLSFPAHTATHVDLVFPERRIAPERMIGPGKLIDVTGAVGDPVTLDDVKDQVRVAPGDFVFFRTDWSELAGTDRYWDHPELAPRVIEWLVSCRVNAVGIDALGIGRGAHHGEYDSLLAREDVLVIENLTNLCRLPETVFTVYCFPLSIPGVDAVPARVLVETAEAE
jgi:kynurenine formamidase